MDSSARASNEFCVLDRSWISSRPLKPETQLWLARETFAFIELSVSVRAMPSPRGPGVDHNEDAAELPVSAPGLAGYRGTAAHDARAALAATVSRVPAAVLDIGKTRTRNAVGGGCGDGQHRLLTITEGPLSPTLATSTQRAPIRAHATWGTRNPIARVVSQSSSE